MRSQNRAPPLPSAQILPSSRVLPVSPFEARLQNKLWSLVVERGEGRESGICDLPSSSGRCHPELFVDNLMFFATHPSAHPLQLFET